MRTKHLIKRGKCYHFVYRVPTDLLHIFPAAVFSRSLKTDCKKHADIICSSYQNQMQKLFMQLRCGLLDKTLQSRLVNMFLLQGLDDLHGIASGGIQAHADIIKSHEARHSVTFTDFEKLDMQASIADKMAAQGKEALRKRDAWMYEPYTKDVATMLKKKHGITLTDTDKTTLALEYENAGKKLNEAEAGIHRGEWGLFEALRSQADTELSQPYALFADVLKEYEAWYTESKPNIKPGTLSDMQVECRTLLEILGNKSIAEINNMQTLTELKGVLRKYPLNRKQKFPDKSLSMIFRTERRYSKISLKTANEYIKRLIAVIDYANKSKLLNASNVAIGELFQTEIAAEDQRQAYDDADIKRLIDAICTQPLWKHKSEPRPERFYLILVSLLHGLRLGNIVALTKKDIVLTDRGTWVMQLRTGKTKATVRSVAICDALLLLGFLEWVAGLKREKLFQDSADSFSKWYNRDEHRADGYSIQGFEPKYVTIEKGKCLYSLRHSFAGNVFDVSTDYKITSDMMGHSTGKSVTARYTKATRVDTLKQMVDKMDLKGIDLDRLEVRARDLFCHI